MKESIKNSYRNAGLVLLFLISCSASAQNYTWIKGSNVLDQSGTYGTLGTPASANNPGGREFPVSWKDASGNFWLFGGLGFDASGNYDFLNDLWKYNVTTNQWTWIKGDNTTDVDGVYGTVLTPASTNKPGSREGSVSWTDAAGNLWLFGGVGMDGASVLGELNDLWKYNISTNQWTWMKGSNNALQAGTYGTQGTAAAANSPGARIGTVGWADLSGNLWMFGGIGYDGVSGYGDLSDLWKYNISTNQWTWMKGNNNADQNGVYGSMGVAAPLNKPGGRSVGSAWFDPAGNLWMMGGYGYDAASFTDDFLNDMWRYSISTNQWTWMKGASSSNQNGIYGTMGVATAANVPGARISSVPWADGSGNFYLFGGVGNDGSGSQDDLNDLWKYSSATNQWTWIKGSNSVAQTSTYGTIGIPAAANTPGARYGSIGWTDASYNLWLFGGFGEDNTGNSEGDLNDLWRLSNCSANPTISITSSTGSVCLGGSATLTAAGANTYIWSNNQAGPVTVVSPTLAGLSTYTSYGSDAVGCVGSATVNLNALALPAVTALSSKATICKGEQVTLTASGAGNYSWNTTPAAASASIVVSPTVSTVYTVTGTSVNGCQKTFTLTQTVQPCTGIESADNLNAAYRIYPNPNNGSFTIKGQPFETAVTFLIFNMLGQEVFEETLAADQTSLQARLQKGIYEYHILQANKKIGSGKIIIE